MNKDHHHRARVGHSAVDGCEHAIELGGPKRLSRVVRLDEEEGSARGVALGYGKVDAAGRTRRCEWNASDLLAVHTNRSGLVIEIPADLELQRRACRWPEVWKKRRYRRVGLGRKSDRG